MATDSKRASCIDGHDVRNGSRPGNAGERWASGSQAFASPSVCRIAEREVVEPGLGTAMRNPAAASTLLV